MKLSLLLKIFLCNTTNPTIIMTDFFQSHHSKVTFPFLECPFFPLLFQANSSRTFTTEIFRKVIDHLYEGSWSDSSYDEQF